MMNTALKLPEDHMPVIKRECERPGRKVRDS
jgi:hypothetical protein